MIQQNVQLMIKHLAHEGEMAYPLEETIQHLDEVIELLEEINLPRGFGRV